MRKGLKNLVAVAVALLGFNAMAMAPVISDLPSPIVGDSNGVTGSGEFVYEDAFSLGAYVSDDFTADEDIVWSYQTMTQRYQINGVGEVTTGQQFNAAGVNLIDDATTDGLGLDADADTITIVDVDANTNGLADLGLDAEASDVVTLFASDISTFSSKSVIFYTDANGEDRLSTSKIPVVFVDFATGANGWLLDDTFIDTGSGAQNASGLCFTVPAGNAGFAFWYSPASSPYELTDNALYDIRLAMSSTSAAGAQPLVAFTLNNTAGTASDGFAYGGQEFFLDQEGSSNSVTSLSGDYRRYYAPPQVGLASWRSTTGGAFDPANDSINDFILQFNLFNIRTDLGSATDAGTICLGSLDIGRADIGSLAVAAADVYAESNLSATTYGAVTDQTFVGTSAVSYAGGNLVWTPTNVELSVLSAGPGDGTFDNTGAGTTDNFPIAWTAGELYQINYSVSQGAGTTSDVISIVVDQPSIENVTNAYAANSNSALGATGLPTPGGSAESMTMFYWTHGGTTAATLAPAWRPFIQIANRQDLGAAQATAVVNIESVDVDQIVAP